MRASETVSEASPGSTASQTGVPTQVVQQVQGTQQVRCSLPLGRGYKGAVLAGTLGVLPFHLPCCQSHLLTWSYQDVCSSHP
jgi:hypothetical protein